MTLEEAINHYEEVTEEQEDFDKFQCGYRKPGCEDGVWKHTCRLPSNIPVGSSWGECSEQNCPLFHECLECANEHRQLAKWLRELRAYREAVKEVKEYASIWMEWNEGMSKHEIAEKAMTDTKEGFIAIVEKHLMEVNADEDSD